MTFRRIIRALSLGIFIYLLVMAAASTLPASDLYLRLDPGLTLITAVSDRVWQWGFLPAVVVLLAAPLVGRAFCGYVCPMGATFDYARVLHGRFNSEFRPEARLRPIKYYLLAFLLAASLLGVSLVFLAAPLSLITRLYGLVLYPAGAFIAEASLNLIRPLGGVLDAPSLTFAKIQAPRFATQLFVFAFFLVLIVLGRKMPRFWCRYLCPTGALLALFSKKPIFSRTVSEECISCGKCAKACPMAAITDEDPAATNFRECIVCHTCQDVCPVDAVSFTGKKAPAPLPDGPMVTRRGVILAGALGGATAIMGLTGLDAPPAESGEGWVEPSMLIRPPGALPESDFLNRCVRCGECMAACPTNTLQPLWFQAGWMGVFSPAVTPRRGFCDPKCNRCGQVCPTEAIRELPEEERIWAKTGTAMILRHKCLAWEHHKHCMVCDEVCPFNAIEFRSEPGIPVPVPRVVEDKCAGCGYCEHFCPVKNQAAIVVTPMNALRMADGSYQEEGTARGYSISLSETKAETVHRSPPPQDGSGSPPGFDEAPAELAPPPGFDETPTDTAPPPGFDPPPKKETAPGSGPTPPEYSD